MIRKAIDRGSRRKGHAGGTPTWKKIADDNGPGRGILRDLGRRRTERATGIEPA